MEIPKLKLILLGNKIDGSKLKLVNASSHSINFIATLLAGG